MNEKNSALTRQKAVILALIKDHRLQEALAGCQQVCDAEPDLAGNWFMLATIHGRLGQLAHAADCCRRVTQLQPDYPDAHFNLGRLLQLQGDFAGAEASFRQALSLTPAHPEAQLGLGQVLQQQQRFDAALASYDVALRLQPGLLLAWFNKGILLQLSGNLELAEQCFRRTLGIQPEFAQAWCSLANLLFQKGDVGEAENCYRKAVQHQPDYVEALANLGKLQQSRCQFSAAEACFRKGLSFMPDNADLNNELGVSLNAQGLTEAAEQAFRKALSLKPDFHEAASNLLLTLNYSASWTPEQVFAEHREWGRWAHQSVRREAGFPNVADPGRRLRIGYVSPDFREHSVACFIEVLLKSRDSERFEAFCYADVRRSDSVTCRLQNLADHWCDIYGRSDQEVAELIRHDGIDILVDLSGHTARNRLLLFASRPAPLQVTYLGYPGTTGLVEMDYRLTDAWSDPPGKSASFYTESLLRLPGCFLCYTPPAEAPLLPVDCPAENGGRVTFGSFNSYVKMTAEVFELWAAILHAVPGSRLLLKNFSLSDPDVRSACHSRFEQQGIESDRLELHGVLASKSEHLGLYQKIDIALDTFPYNGTTTTCEALWMGVPVITLAGDRHAGRVGVSLLSALGLPQLIAPDRKAFLELAVALANDGRLRREWRSSLRDLMRNSTLCDAPEFCRNVESAYRAIWTEWCREILNA